MNYVFPVPKKLDSWSNFRRKIFLGKFLSHQKIRLWISGVSLELFLSYRAYFHRYRYFRGFFETWIRFSKSCFILTKMTFQLDIRTIQTNIACRNLLKTEQCRYPGIYFALRYRSETVVANSIFIQINKNFRKKWDFIGSFICSYGEHQLKRIWTRMII